MELVEVAKLYKHIKKHYHYFDASAERVKEDHERYLKDFPAEVAWANIHQHILTETNTPIIAHIRGRLGDLMDSQRSKDQATAYKAQLDEWAEASKTPPPEGYWEAVRQKILQGAKRGEQQHD
ncbi:hypothetical protein [Paenibacillus sp. SYP-B4298]|uniref:hypothetical protein n=1 Tax=Paenibacillus sp. SYP-B4298 TaxID=2996034 RepID=UPI0022DD65DF|nr:hypothetical protein [Paenibacillus sp. SYP-B4298]